MTLTIIVGSGAVGKMTVGQELMKRTGHRLFHNHMMIEPVIEIFGAYHGKTVSRLRRVIFEELLNSELPGVVFTYMWAFDQQDDWDYITGVASLFEEKGAEVNWVELVAPQEIRLLRNGTQNRLNNKASKRNQEFSRNCILQEDANYRLVSHEGEIPFANYIRIDNAELEPGEAAEIIMERFHMERVESASLK